MSRTNGQFQMKTPFTDGLIWFNPINNCWAQAGGATLTRGAAASYYLLQAASQSGVIVVAFDNVLKRLGTAPFLQEQFGTAAGVAGPTGVANTSDPDGNTIAPYIPPMTKASMTTITGGEAGFVPKGIRVDNVALVYQVNTLALTSIGIRVDKVSYTNNAAPVVVNVLANGANGLQTAVQAQPYVTVIPIAGPVFDVTDNTTFTCEITPVTPATSTFQLFGVALHVSFNYN